MIDQDKRKEVEFFDRHAELDDYNVFTDGSNDRLIDAFIRLTGLGHGAKVADLGCGSGIFTHLLKKRGLQTEGVDISPQLIQIADGVVVR